MLYSSFDMAMKLVTESKDGFGTSMLTGKNTGLIMVDWTYGLTAEKVPCIVRSCRAQTAALQPQLLIYHKPQPLTPTPTLTPSPSPSPSP